MIALKYGKRRVVNYRGARMVVGGLSSKNRIDILVHIAKEFATISNQTVLLDQVVALCVEIFEVDNVTIRLWDKNRERLVPRKFLKQSDPPRRDLKRSEGYSGAVYARGDSLLLDNLENYPGYLDEGESTRCAVVVPIVTRDEILGTIAIEKDTAYFYKKDDLDILVAMASQLGIKLNEVSLIEGLVEARQRIESDLKMGRDVQSQFIPSHIPAWNGIRFSTHYDPMVEVSGDYFDAIRKGNTLTFMIADVSGHGVPAALVTMSLHHHFTRCAETGYGLLDMLDEINEALRPRLTDGSYVTAQLIRIRADHSYSMVSAGHPHAQHYDMRSGKFRAVGSAGLPLGIGRIHRDEYVEESGRLEPGDILVLLTDGFVEQRIARREQAGLERILGWLGDSFGRVQAKDPTFLEQALSHFLAEFRTATREMKRGDDLSLVFIQAHPDAGESHDYFQRAVQADRGGLFEEALVSARQAYQVDPSLQTNLMLLTRLAMRASDYVEAARFLQEYITGAGAHSSSVFHAMGALQYRLGRKVDAKRFLKKALALDPTTGKSSLLLARVYADELALEKANRVLLDARKASPGDERIKKALERLRKYREEETVRASA